MEVAAAAAEREPRSALWLHYGGRGLGFGRWEQGFYMPLGRWAACQPIVLHWPDYLQVMPGPT
jgi:hypothetical protein